MSELIDRIDKKNLSVFKNYIHKIRFPKYKNFTKNLEVTFDFPFTVLTGANGCGKTSVLQALYGCPHKKSVSEFWFSTDLDPIKEGDGEANRYIYEYMPPGLSKKIEVIKKRVGKSKGNDYWETARPSVKDGMTPPGKVVTKEEKNYRSTTRWKAVEREVVYINFKESISSFDKFISYGNFDKGEKITTKQDFIRKRSQHVMKCVNGEDLSKYYTMKAYSREFLGENELKKVGEILGKKYESALIISHDFFNNHGISVIFKEKGPQYSEALAGSGEVSVITSVMKIMGAPKYSLILLDEPEVSLHPNAQNGIKKLLLEKCLKDHCQVVITSHSPSFIEGIPNKAIKTFYQDDLTRQQKVINSSTKDQAFMRIGHLDETASKIVFVEDVLSALFFSEALSDLAGELTGLWEAKVYPGGGKTIIKNKLVDMAVTSHFHPVLLDGDEKKTSSILPSEIPECDYPNIDDILIEYTGTKSYVIPSDSGDTSSEDLQVKLKILDAYNEHVYFIPHNIPEEFLCEVTSDKIEVVDDCYKKSICRHTENLLGSKKIKSSEIFTVQRMLLAKRDREHASWKEFMSTVKEITNNY